MDRARVAHAVDRGCIGKCGEGAHGAAVALTMLRTEYRAAASIWLLHAPRGDRARAAAKVRGEGDRH